MVTNGSELQRHKLLADINSIKNRLARLYGRGQISLDKFTFVMDRLEVLRTALEEVTIDDRVSEVGAGDRA